MTLVNTNNQSNSAVTTVSRFLGELVAIGGFLESDRALPSRSSHAGASNQFNHRDSRQTPALYKRQNRSWS